MFGADVTSSANATRVQNFFKEAAGEILTIGGIGYLLVGILQYSLAGKISFPSFGLLFPRLIANIVLLATPFLIFRVVLGIRGMVITSLATVISFASFNVIKIGHLREPIVFVDLLSLRGNWQFLLRYLTLGAITSLVGGLIVVATFFFFEFKRRSRMTLPRSAAVGMIFVFFCLLTAEGAGEISLFSPGLKFYYDSLKSAQDFGYVFSQVSTLKNLLVAAPAHYNEGKIQEILAGNVSDPGHLAVTPIHRAGHDVILILLESFWDPFEAGVPFKKDFLTFYHSLKRTSKVQAYLSPVYGGGTANSEFEVLTGIPTNAFPSGTFPYVQYLHRRTPSIVHLFRKAGYETIAIHHNSKRFWSRNDAYPNLGFDKFISRGQLDRDFPGASKDPDHSLFSESLSLLKGSRTSEFQFLITIGTHSPYECDDGLGKKWFASDSSHPASQETECALNTYAEKMHQLDEELQDYFSQLRKLSDPPTVILFGDHLPSFADKLVQEKVAERSFGMHGIEAVIFSPKHGNDEKAAVLSEDPKLFCLSPIILRLGGVPLTPYFAFNKEYCERQSESQNGNREDDLRELSFDRILGNQYSIRKRIPIR